MGCEGAPKGDRGVSSALALTFKTEHHMRFNTQPKDLVGYWFQVPQQDFRVFCVSDYFVYDVTIKCILIGIFSYIDGNTYFYGIWGSAFGFTLKKWR